MSEEATNPTEQEEEPLGLRCARCGCRHFYVTHTEPLPRGRIRRRRQCRHCGRKIVTYEQKPGADLRGVQYKSG